MIIRITLEERLAGIVLSDKLKKLNFCHFLGKIVKEMIIEQMIGYLVVLLYILI